METKSQAPAAFRADGASYTRIPVVGTLMFLENPTRDKFVNPPQMTSKELDLFSPDSTAFAFLIRGDALKPVVFDGWYAVFSQGKKPEAKDFVLVQMKTGLNFFGRLISSDDKKVVLLTPEDEEVALATEQIALMSRMVIVSKDRGMVG